MASKSSKLIFSKSLNLYYYKESNLVVKSDKEKFVIGRLENKEFVPFDDRTLELCEEYGMEPDPSKIEESKKEEESETQSVKENDEEDTVSLTKSATATELVAETKIEPVLITEHKKETVQSVQPIQSVQTNQSLATVLSSLQSLFNSLEQKLYELEKEREKLLLNIKEKDEKLNTLKQFLNKFT